ncbi:MAG: hypothetical protein ACXWPM_08070 [Bdellovibrionota bacterium]
MKSLKNPRWVRVRACGGPAEFVGKVHCRTVRARGGFARARI